MIFNAEIAYFGNIFQKPLNIEDLDVLLHYASIWQRE
jgi:hypothetical protein